jgi:uncharacterized membrane protein
MAVLACLVSTYALALLLVRGMGPPFLADRRVTMPLALYAHLAGSLWALATGPFQLNQNLRARSINRHRWIGRSYVAGVLVGGLGGLALAPFAETGTVASLGFGTLAVLWLGFTTTAFVTIRQGDRTAHRRWMIRSYSLTLAAVCLRLYLPISFIAQIPFETAYPVIAWLFPNLSSPSWSPPRRGRCGGAVHVKAPSLRPSGCICVVRSPPCGSGLSALRLGCSHEVSRGTAPILDDTRIPSLRTLMGRVAGERLPDLSARR